MIRKINNGKKMIERCNKIVLLMEFILVIILGISISSAITWERGSLHQHTGYSTILGPDRAPFGGDGCDALLEGHLGSLFNGYTVAELKLSAMNLGLDWLAFSDHSYCINSTEFNTVKSDCINAQNSSFSCLWGEELSVAEIVNEIEHPLVVGCHPLGIGDEGENRYNGGIR